MKPQIPDIPPTELTAMSLAKAIEIGEELNDFNLTHYNLDSGKALGLLIEAGKRVLERRAIVRAPQEDFLPGETED